MDSNDDFYGKELNLNCFYMHTNFGQKYLKTAIVAVHCLQTRTQKNGNEPEQRNGWNCKILSKNYDFIQGIL